MLTARGVIAREQLSSGDLTEAIAVTMRFGCLLDLPEHPYEGRAQADDDAQKQQRQTRGCEHGEHPSTNANGVPANGIPANGVPSSGISAGGGQKTALKQKTPRSPDSSRAKLILYFN
jgi:hypothetical protein